MTPKRETPNNVLGGLVATKKDTNALDETT